MKHVLFSPYRYDPPVHEGVAAYAAERDWLLNTELVRGLGRLQTEWGWSFEWDGIIGCSLSLNTHLENAVLPDCPQVLLNNNVPTPEHPSVSTNVVKTAAIAFDFYRRKGFRYFGVYGWEPSLRLRRFKSLVESEVGPCRALYNSYSNVVAEGKRIRDWLKDGPMPMAVFCNNDDDGYSFIHLATEFGFNVPRDVAVLGTDDSRLVCESCRVPLSSIDTNLFEVGYRAAEKLDKLMNGDLSVEPQTLIDPKGVVARASTDTIGAVSPHVRRAIDIMERDFGKGISVGDVLADLDISHTGLIEAFKRELGYTPISALRNVRMREAAHLLTSTDKKVLEIASAVGMSNVDYFQTAFKRYFGVTPRTYRRKARDG